jgi:arabinose-5-phosphate isomerase
MSTSRAESPVSDVMLPLTRVPVVGPETLLKATLAEMTRHKLGIACIVEKDGRLAGIFTDGDVRRMLLRDQKPFSHLFADDIIRHATKEPTTVRGSDTLAHAIVLMEQKEVWDLPVVHADGRLAGLLHLHPAIKAVLEV